MVPVMKLKRDNIDITNNTAANIAKLIVYDCSAKNVVFHHHFCFQVDFFVISLLFSLLDPPSLI